MATYLLAWNGRKWHSHSDDISDVLNTGDIRAWSCANKAIKAGDRVFNIRLGKEPRGIWASGVATSGLYEAPHFDPDLKAAGKIRTAVDIELQDILNPAHQPLFPMKRLAQGALAGMHWETQRSGVRIPDDVASVLEEEWAEFLVGAAAQPTTPTVRNPPWQRDELILALDLYFRVERKLPDETHPEVLQLSALLNQLPIHAVRPDGTTFRNPNGVALKLANFRAIDQPGHGMQRGNRLERVVWDEFAPDPTRLRTIAANIGSGVSAPEVKPQSVVLDDEQESEFPEGRILFRSHQARERSGALPKVKKAQALKKNGKLRCQACGFDFSTTYGVVGEGFIECHHTIPVFEMLPGAKTKLADVVLLCSNRHRMIHRRRPWLGVGQLGELLA